MRERADAVDAGSGAWWPRPDSGDDGCDDLPRLLRIVEDQEEALADARHISSWSPAAALAVADWLHGVATNVERRSVESVSEVHAALTVARAYLREDA